MSDGLFDDLIARQKQRLQELGWTTTPVYGTTLWVHPRSRAWYTEAQVLEWLAAYDRKQEGGQQP